MTNRPTADPDVVDDEDARRYEIRVGTRLAGFLRYRVVGDRLVFIHTEVDADFAGQGIGGRLGKAALDDVRRRGRVISPVCPFVIDYLQRHPEDLDLVDDRRRSTVTAGGAGGAEDPGPDVAPP